MCGRQAAKGRTFTTAYSGADDGQIADLSRLKVEGAPFRRRVERLLVGSRDGSRLIDGVLRQVDVVRGLIDGGVPVHGLLCFVEADWPLLGGNVTT